MLGPGVVRPFPTLPIHEWSGLAKPADQGRKPYSDVRRSADLMMRSEVRCVHKERLTKCVLSASIQPSGWLTTCRGCGRRCDSRLSKMLNGTILASNHRESGECRLEPLGWR